MKTVLQDNQDRIVRFDAGEEVISALAEIARTEGMDAAHFTAIGAASSLVLSYYNLAAKQYEDHEIQEDLEITGIVGNIALLDSKVVLHAHGTFSREDLSVVGGHVKKLIVSATCEVHLTQLTGQLNRRFDEQTGLNLLT